MLEYPLLLIFPAAMAFGAVMDLLTMTIPNRVSIVLVAGFLLAAVLTGMPASQMAMHLAAGLSVLGVGFVMFARGWVGGGDAKLLAAASLWLGFDNLLSYFILTSFLGGGLAILLLSYRRFVPPLWLTGQDWAMRLHDPRIGIPYGIALSGAALWLFPTTAMFKAAAF